MQVVSAGALSISTAAQLATIKRPYTTSTPNHQLLKLWGMDSQICTKTGMTSSLSSSREATSSTRSTQSLSGVTDTPVTHRATLVLTNMVLVGNLTSGKTTEEVDTLSSLFGVVREITARMVIRAALTDNLDSLVDPRSI